MSHSPRRPALAVATTVSAAVAAATLASPVLAADPDSSTIKAPKKGTRTSTWSGSIATPGADLYAELGAVDTHDLTVAVKGKAKKVKKFFKRNVVTLDVAIAWSGVHNDLDLYVYDEDGAELAVSGDFATTGEAVSIPVTEPGTYTVEVVSYLAEPGVSYDAEAALVVSR